jgi:hypothetical protein
MSIGKEGERFVRSEITGEEVKKMIEYFEEMISWVGKNCEVVPIKGALDIPRERKGPLTEMLGGSFLDTILISTESGNLLFSDDERLRTFAKSEFGVDGVWTQILLMFALNEKAIEKSRYNEVILNLICAHYYHIGIDADILIEAARKSDWAPSYPYTTILKLLGSDRSDITSALAVSTAFLYELWKQPILPERRDYLIYELLNVVTVGRDRRRILTKLIGMIRGRFLLLPLEERRIISIIELWQRLHLV